MKDHKLKLTPYWTKLFWIHLCGLGFLILFLKLRDIRFIEVAVGYALISLNNVLLTLGWEIILFKKSIAIGIAAIVSKYAILLLALFWMPIVLGWSIYSVLVGGGAAMVTTVLLMIGIESKSWTRK